MHALYLQSVNKKFDFYIIAKGEQKTSRLAQYFYALDVKALLLLLHQFAIATYVTLYVIHNVMCHKHHQPNTIRVKWMKARKLLNEKIEPTLQYCVPSTVFAAHIKFVGLFKPRKLVYCEVMQIYRHFQEHIVSITPQAENFVWCKQRIHKR